MEIQNEDVQKNVMQSNLLTSGRYDFSSCQMDILFMLLASLEKGDDASKEYLIHVKDIKLLIGRDWNYTQLLESTEDLMSRVFQIVKPESIVQINLFSKVEYYTGTGSFGIKINPDVKHYFFDLKDNFTYFQLVSALNCKSKHAKRLYTIACQHRTYGGFQEWMPIGEFKEILGLKDPKGKEPEQYQNHTDFKINVLEKAKNQINKYTDIEFDYKFLKRGKAFSHIKILCYNDLSKGKQLTLNLQESPKIQLNTKTVVLSGFSEKQAAKIVANGFPFFEEEKKKMLADITSGKKKIDNTTAYLTKIMQAKGIL